MKGNFEEGKNYTMWFWN